MKDYAYSFPLANTGSGNYVLRLAVLDKDGKTVASGNRTFTVQSTAQSGIGLTGSIVVTTKQVPLGNAATFREALNNSIFYGHKPGFWVLSAFSAGF